MQRTAKYIARTLLAGIILLHISEILDDGRGGAFVLVFQGFTALAFLETARRSAA